MSNTALFVHDIKNGVEPDNNDSVFATVWKQYERVIIESLITSFGLDFIIQDQTGGDVDTVYNVRENGVFKSKANATAYANRGTYDTSVYHSDSKYTTIVKNAKTDFDINGTKVTDIYTNGDLIPRTNNTIPRSQQAQLDHIISSKTIHDDPARILADISGTDLANNPSNLGFTNANLNNNMRDKSLPEYLKWCEDNPDKVNYNGVKGKPLPDDVKEKLTSEYKRAKKDYDRKINIAYYTSSKFAKDTAIAAGKLGVKMGIKQAIGFVFCEIWFAIKEELQNAPAGCELKQLVEKIGSGVKKGAIAAREKYKEIFAKLCEGAFSGVLANLTTTLCNIFFTTGKFLVKNIRHVFSAVVQAGNVLLFNPDNLLFGERIKTASVIIATGAGVLVGTGISAVIASTPVGQIPLVGNIVSTFCGTLVSGLLSCSLLLLLDRSKTINHIIDCMNRIPSEVNNYAEIAAYMTYFAAKLGEIDYEAFRLETEKYASVAEKINNTTDEDDLNGVLLDIYDSINISIPWSGQFDSFMADKTKELVY